MTKVWFFYLMITWVTPSSLGIQIPEAIELWKSETWSYPLYTLAYMLVMKNTGSNQAKHKLSQISLATNLLKGFILIHFWRLMMIKKQFAYS